MFRAKYSIYDAQIIVDKIEKEAWKNGSILYIVEYILYCTLYFYQLIKYPKKRRKNDILTHYLISK